MQFSRFLSAHAFQTSFFFLIVIGTILRLYRLPYTLQFLGDQGRDALIARRILIERDPAFIGPVTSVGNMYLGPFYYYFMVLPLMLTYPSPLGPAYAVAILGSITLALIYILGKDMVGRKTAMLAMALYAVSPVVISNVRFSWNPNVVPFFSLILVWALHRALGGRQRSWVTVGIAATILFQLHYIALILIGCAGLIWIYCLFKQWKKDDISRTFIFATIAAFIFFLLSLIPLFLFDLRHDFLNLRAFGSFFGINTAPESESHFRTLRQFWAFFYAYVGMGLRIVYQIFGIVIQPKALLAIFLMTGYFFVRSIVIQGKEKTHKTGKGLLFFLFLTSVLILSLYKGSIFDHYLGFLFPVTILTIATVLRSLWRDIYMRPLVAGAFLVFCIVSLLHYPGTQDLGLNIYTYQKTASLIASKVQDGESYNILLLSDTHDYQGMNYRYFLTALAHTPPASENDSSSFRKLFIIDEQHSQNPVDGPQYLIAIWPNRTIIDRFSAPNGADVYVLER